MRPSAVLNRLQIVGTVTAGVNGQALGLSVAKWEKNLWRGSASYFSNHSPTGE